jgi:GT2 family glycosyltransferase
VNRDREKVLIAYPHGTIESGFHRDLIHLLVWDAQHAQHVVKGGGHLMLATTNLPHARNQIVSMFLEHEEWDWLWFVDTDQTFPADTLDRMLRSAHPVDRPVLGALVYSYDVQTVPRSRPTIWTWGDDGLPARWTTHPRDELVTCNATGTGCVLIHRRVFEGVAHLQVPGQDITYGETSWPWYRYGEWRNADGNPDVFGEDLTFMARVGAAGFPIHVDTRIKVGHVKRFEVDEPYHYSELPFAMVAPETYVVIPVKDRLDLTKQILGQLEAQGGYKAIFVYDNGSGPQTKKWLAQQRIAEVFDAEGMNIHEMWNAGCAEAVKRWAKPTVAILNNDLDLGPNFLGELGEALRFGGDDKLVTVSANYDGREGPQVLPVRGICANRYDGSGGWAGFAFALKGELWANGLRFDEQFALWYGDNDYLLQTERVGGWYGIATRATCEHLGGGSQTTREHDVDAVIAADRAKFKAKWAA